MFNNLILLFMTENTSRKMVNLPVFPSGSEKSGVAGGEGLITSPEFGTPSNGVRVFESPQFGKIRVAGTGDEPLFCLGDVCGALGYKNSRDALRKHVEEEDVAKCDTLTKGGLQSMTYVTEGGLYSLVFGSKVEGARLFKKWVTSEVLPTIRKTGGYGVPKSFPEALMLAYNQAKQIEAQQLALAQKQAENDKLVADGKAKDVTIARMKPKETMFDILVANKSLNCIKSFAQNYCMTARAMNTMLNDYGIQYKQGDQWFLYSKYVGKGYVTSEPVTITHSDGSVGYKYHTKWTFEGFVFLYEFLKEKGILPLVERNMNSEAHKK